MKMHARRILLGVLLVAVLQPFPGRSASPQAGTFDIVGYFEKEDAWTIKPDLFVISGRPYGFRFLDGGRTSVISTKHDRLLFLGIPVYEARVYWGEGGIRRAEFSIFNKGDAERPLDRRGFEALVERLDSELSRRYGRGRVAPADKPGAGMVVCHSRWLKQSPMIQMDWAYVKPRGHGEAKQAFLPEFIRVVFVPKTGMAAKDVAALTGKGMLIRAKSLSELRKNLVRNSKGDVMIDNVPMVDQGEKGYCAAASAERILRYYGLEIDQHQVAQLAETGARGGTSLQGITTAVSAIGRDFKLDEKALLKIEEGASFQKSQTYEDLGEYNKIAREKGVKEIVWEDFVTKSSAHTRTIDLQKIWTAMDPALLMEARLRQRARFGKFKRDIRSYVDKGIPLLWSSLVGIYPEVPDLNVQGVFGHIRLIIGYNEKTDEIIYSDSWGAHHAVKRMGCEQAWAMTKGLLVLRPRM